VTRHEHLELLKQAIAAILKARAGHAARGSGVLMCFNVAALAATPDEQLYLGRDRRPDSQGVEETAKEPGRETISLARKHVRQAVGGKHGARLRYSRSHRRELGWHRQCRGPLVCMKPVSVVSKVSDPPLYTSLSNYPVLKRVLIRRGMGWKTTDLTDLTDQRR
jgi:hypothetical protein